MPKVTIDLPEEVFSARNASPKDMYWYQRTKISQKIAAQIAGLNRRDFIDAAADEKVDVFVVDFDDLKRELKLAGASRY